MLKLSPNGTFEMLWKKQTCEDWNYVYRLHIDHCDTEQLIHWCWTLNNDSLNFSFPVRNCYCSKRLKFPFACFFTNGGKCWKLSGNVLFTVWLCHVTLLSKCKCDLSRENVHYGYPFECLKTVCLPFAIRSWSVGRCSNGLDWIIHSEKFLAFKQLLLSVQKRSSSVRTDDLSHLNKIFIRSNGWGYPFAKIFIHSNGWGYPFKKNRHLFERLRSSVRTAKGIHSKKWSSLRKNSYSK